MDGDGDEDECFNQVTSDGVIEMEMSFPIKVTLCVSDHVKETQFAKERIVSTIPVMVMK